MTNYRAREAGRAARDEVIKGTASGAIGYIDPHLRPIFRCQSLSLRPFANRYMLIQLRPNPIATGKNWRDSRSSPRPSWFCSGRNYAMATDQGNGCAATVLNSFVFAVAGAALTGSRLLILRCNVAKPLRKRLAGYAVCCRTLSS